jgi:hypothetical protein
VTAFYKAMPKIRLQVVLRYAGFLLFGFVGAGNVLNAIINARALITTSVAVVLTSSVLAFWLLLEVWVRHARPRATAADGASLLLLVSVARLGQAG